MEPYTLIQKTYGSGRPCTSHLNIPIEHLFGNTNWTMAKPDATHVQFTCLQCGQILLYKINTEKTLL